MKITTRNISAQEQLDHKIRKSFYINLPSSMILCTLFMGIGLYFYNLNIKLDAINKNIQAISNTNQTWDISLPQN